MTLNLSTTNRFSLVCESGQSFAKKPVGSLPTRAWQESSGKAEGSLDFNFIERWLRGLRHDSN